jgi:hypothetical protein
LECERKLTLDEKYGHYLNIYQTVECGIGRLTKFSAQNLCDISLKRNFIFLSYDVLSTCFQKVLLFGDGDWVVNLCKVCPLTHAHNRWILYSWKASSMVVFSFSMCLFLIFLFQFAKKLRVGAVRLKGKNLKRK